MFELLAAPLTPSCRSIGGAAGRTAASMAAVCG
jgi:hypothetical protein